MNEGTPVNHPRTPSQIAAALLTVDYTPPDNKFGITGSGDATKVARFEVDGISAGTTRTFTLPDASITVAGVNLAQTWTATQTFAAIAATTISASGVITSTVATGTAPLTVASTTAVANLNASLLLGNTWAAPGAIGGTTPGSAAHTTISATGVITSTLATGTAPFTVASTTAVANLNASLLLGSTWAIPGSIGATTPAAGAFTTLSASSTLAVTGVTTHSAKAVWTGGSFGSITSGQGQLYGASASGLIIAGNGSSTDVGLYNSTGGAFIEGVHATQRVLLAGASDNGTDAVQVNGTAKISGNTTVDAGGSETLLTLSNGSSGWGTLRLRSGSTHTAWIVSAQNTVNEAFEITPSASVGTTTFTTPAFLIFTTGSIVLGPRAALATNATDGFVYIPTCAGTPTGTPTAVTGKVAFQYDTTNNKLYAYNGAWKSVTLA